MEPDTIWVDTEAIQARFSAYLRSLRALIRIRGKEMWQTFLLSVEGFGTFAIAYSVSGANGFSVNGQTIAVAKPGFFKWGAILIIVSYALRLGTTWWPDLCKVLIWVWSRDTTQRIKMRLSTILRTAAMRLLETWQNNSSQ